MYIERVGTIEEKSTIELSPGKSLDIEVEYTNTSPTKAAEGSTERRTAQLGIMQGVVRNPGISDSKFTFTDDASKLL